ncbi:MAG: SOS response-associated peptidase [Planctomycetes bacterium]|nr:SOS response-associated peptidase [Planctomycetota bacterium]
MCGRLFLARRAREIAEILGIRLGLGAERWTPRYNVAPTQDVLAVVAEEAVSVVEPRRWGLIPSWAKEASIGHHMINARIETVASKPSFWRLLRSNRCVVLAEGFFEWRRDRGAKVPYAIRSPGKDVLLGFAGLWARWQPSEGEEILSCTIITRPAAGNLNEIHDRMPALLPREAWGEWVEKEVSEPAAAVKLVEDVVPPKLEAVQITSLVNNPRNDTPEVLKPA